VNLAHSYPPNIGEIKKVFPIYPGVVYTYGDTLHAPDGGLVSLDLAAHEEVHSKQQVNPEEWWSKYLVDPEFRTSQEVEAYRAQYQFYCKHFKDRNQRARFLHKIACDFSSKLYGGCITYQQAIIEIKKT
jgi:hypothetical protein